MIRNQRWSEVDKKGSLHHRDRNYRMRLVSDYKERLEAEYQKYKIKATRENEDYEAQYGKIERKKKKHGKKEKDEE